MVFDITYNNHTGDSVTTESICPACDGTGISLVPSYDEDNLEKEPCMYCGGKGKLENKDGQ